MDKQHDTIQNPCEGNICIADPDNNLRTWFSNEKICSYRPRPRWLQNMAKIQRLYLKGKVDSSKYFTKEMLEKMTRVRAGITGVNPDYAIVAKKVGSREGKTDVRGMKRSNQSLREIEAINSTITGLI